MSKKQETSQPNLKLYGISGIITHDEHTDIEPAAFGGYFRLNPSDRKIVDGHLIDYWGPSTITGKMEPELLVMTKMYYTRYDWVQYELKKKNGIWVGKYGVFAESLDYPHFMGRARCRVQFIENDVSDIVSGILRDKKNRKI